MDFQAFYEANIERYVVGLATSILILGIGWLISKWANRLTQRICRKYDPALSGFLGGIAQYFILAIAVITSLAKVGVETTSMVAVLASAGLAIGLALQGNLANFASGVMILIFRPFDLDHKVTLAGHTGIVKDVGIFATTMLQPDNVKIIIPNAQVTGNAIFNFTEQGLGRASVDVGVAYGANVEQVREVLLGAAKRVENVLEEPEPGCFLANLGASSLDFKVTAWCQPGDVFGVSNAMRVAVYDDLNAAGIEIPFNQIVVHRAETE